MPHRAGKKYLDTTLPNCAGMSGDFEGWDLEEQKALTAKLIAALRKTPLHSVAYTVLLDDLKEVWLTRFGAKMRKDHVMVAAYHLTMQHCMMKLGEYLYSLNPGIRITIIHDHSDYDEVMLTAFNYVKYKLNPPFADLFSTIAPMTSKDCLPLQLADFLAYEFFRDRGGRSRRGIPTRGEKVLT